MNRPPWTFVQLQDRDAFRIVITFLERRLCEKGTIDWALRLKPNQRIERLAVLDMLNGSGASNLPEPWATTWRLIEESWSFEPPDRNDGTAIYFVQKRLRAGDRSGSLIDALVRLVAPRLHVQSVESWLRSVAKTPLKPKKTEHLLSAYLTSGDLIDFNVLELNNLTDAVFLGFLANALEAAVNHGLDIGHRLGWDGRGRLWPLGHLNRVYYVGTTQQTDPDGYHPGIAPPVKLLHAVVARIADLDPNSVLPVVRRWGIFSSPIHVRLWTAMARDRRLVSPTQIGEFLMSLDDERFWKLHIFPEIAELRALRFGELDLKVQKAIAARIRKLPPRAHWPRNGKKEEVKSARVYSAVRELKRIEVAGGQLPKAAKSWLTTQVLHFGDLVGMTIDTGFPEGPTVTTLPRNPDERYDLLVGAVRLRELETALSQRSAWGGPDDRAAAWIQQPGRAVVILSDLESVGNAGGEYPNVWNQFGWTHSPGSLGPAAEMPQHLQDEAIRVLRLLSRLPERALSASVNGICAWLDAWKRSVIASELGLSVWFRVWPISVEATNNTPESDGDSVLNFVAPPADNDREPKDLDTLNTPAGKLVTVFLAACPRLTPGTPAFADGSTERRMRDTIIASTRRAGLIVRHRLIEDLAYFQHADAAWARRHLIDPLLRDDTEALALWRAIARQTQFFNVLREIGGAMAERAVDRRLGRETRRGLVFSLVVESLNALQEHRDPAVAIPRIQQMLRTIDDELRGFAANAVHQFVVGMSARHVEGQTPASVEELFRTAAAPFLQRVWPQERSLATPGVSEAFSKLPAASGGAFADAVGVIDRFLVPFDCWSMLNYGLFSGDAEPRKLAMIDDDAKGRSLLRLLDLTVGKTEGAIVPVDLTDALDQIRAVAPALADVPEFRRLLTAARR